MSAAGRAQRGLVAGVAAQEIASERCVRVTFRLQTRRAETWLLERKKVSTGFRLARSAFILRK